MNIEFKDELRSLIRAILETLVPDVYRESVEEIDKDPLANRLKRRAALAPVFLNSVRSKELIELANVGE